MQVSTAEAEGGCYSEGDPVEPELNISLLFHDLVDPPNVVKPMALKIWLNYILK